MYQKSSSEFEVNNEGLTTHNWFISYKNQSFTCVVRLTSLLVPMPRIGVTMYHDSWPPCTRPEVMILFKSDRSIPKFGLCTPLEFDQFGATPKKRLLQRAWSYPMYVVGWCFLPCLHGI